MNDFQARERVTRGVRWYRANVAPSMQARINLEDLPDTDMANILSYVYDIAGSKNVLNAMNLSTREAQDLGLWHQSAGGKMYLSRSWEEDQEVGREYMALGREWKRQLQADSFDGWLTATF